MSIKTWVAKRWARKTRARILEKGLHAPKWQAKTFRHLIKEGAKTAFGKAHQFDQIKDYADFQRQVPVRNYEQAKEWFDRIYQGETHVTWPGKPSYLAKTSGTTSGSKYIPISKASIRHQVSAARDALLSYIACSGNAHFLDGKMMFLSGSPEIERNIHGLKTGRLSGIVNHFVPAYLTRNRVPSFEANIIEDWETKVKTIVQEIKGEDLRLISGIPPWVQMLFEELEAQTGQRPLEVWPNLQLFVQGGVDFSPYQPIFENYFQSTVAITEVFPASEGFFAFQDDPEDQGLMILPDQGIFFEFIPMDEYGKENPRRLTIEEVEIDQQYALILSSNAGLWAYDIGDTIKFTSIKPWKLRVTGRVKHFISAFGEHVISEEVNQAILEAIAQTQANFQEFTVAPLIKETQGESAHQWLIEFVEAPKDHQAFAEVLDQAMRRQNPYYEDLRAGNLLRKAEVVHLSPGASRAYMKAIGKLGGQNKFPRLSNERKIADFLLKWQAEQT
ncbi:MAG: GH3 auxin-responsive promoter family protein [Bacteroidota bacterium]